MATKRFLVKMADGAAPRLAGAGPSLAGAGLRLQPLFKAPIAPTAPGGMGLAGSGRSARWYVAEPMDGGHALRLQDRLGGEGDWDVAHRLLSETLADPAARGEVLAVEPDILQAWTRESSDRPQGPGFAAAPTCDEPDPQRRGEIPSVGRFAWHLDDDFTGLRAAREAVGAEAGRRVTIAHLDTGYDESHRTLPTHLDRARQRSFVEGEASDDARDRRDTGFLRNPGHGTGTLGILAGRRLDDMVPVVLGVRQEPLRPDDPTLGGAPHAAVVPVRIANSVVQFRTSAVAQGFAYAAEQGADVLSMSMGGLPSAAWADAVNAAYEAGLVMVCAAGNNFSDFPTSSVVYPARFNRVIAACGVMADDRPYYHLPPSVMQGCHGPPSKMASAMAAYTPNIPWPRIDCPGTIDLDGQGTSAATPQIAAAAALWLARHRDAVDRYPERWMRVAAVRKALFETARRAEGGEGGDLHVFFGQGILAAKEALASQPASADDLRAWRSEPDSADFSLLKLLTGLGAARDPRLPLFELEFGQLVLQSKLAREVVPDPDVGGERIRDKDRLRLAQVVLDEGRTSAALQAHLQAAVGRPTTVGSTAASGPPNGAAPAAPGVERRTVRPPPKHRRLQIFATDPGASNRLKTAFVNRSVVKVPWEPNLQAGPVGEYVEVIDVDPASGRVYEPVDLNDPFLLAEDGLAPSVGNPQFHQQMVYAVAMRTVENFERALGRVVLWAPKLRYLPKDVTAAKQERPGLVTAKWEEIYVKRLRVYPHALRQANAFYSPDKAALLFGYFPDGRGAGLAGDEGQGGGTVFTCLSHDIVAHETTHAVLDGLHRRYQEATNPDVHAFHEALADIVAIFQHFTDPGLLAFEIQDSRADLRAGTFLVDLARQFGEALGYQRALRSALGHPERTLANTPEPHDRGAILVAAVFDAFFSVYRRRIDDLLRIATGGSGVLGAGALHPDLVRRLADEAAGTAQDMLTIAIRALDYCPPVDITFGDYLRALITADSDLVAEDVHGYRTALLEAFAAREIFPEGVRSLSVESLRWAAPWTQPAGLGEALRLMKLDWRVGFDREKAYRAAKTSAAALHGWIATHVGSDVAPHLGLDFRLGTSGKMERKFEVHSVRPARRVSRDGSIRNDVIAVITQWRWEPLDPKHPLDPDRPERNGFKFRGGCTLVIDAERDEDPIRYCVMKDLAGERRLARQRAFLSGRGESLRSLYFGEEDAAREPFAMIHCGH